MKTAWKPSRQRQRDGYRYVAGIGWQIPKEITAWRWGCIVQRYFVEAMKEELFAPHPMLDLMMKGKR